MPGGKDRQRTTQGLIHAEGGGADGEHVGVEVVKLDCREVKWHADLWNFEKMAFYRS